MDYVDLKRIWDKALPSLDPSASDEAYFQTFLPYCRHLFFLGGEWTEVLPTLLCIFLLGVFVFKQKPVKLRHKESGLTTTARIGWSWTYFIFGAFVPFFRNEGSVGVWYLLCDFLQSKVILSFFYNQQHLIRLMQEGWVLDDAPEVEAQVRKLLGISDN